MATRCFSPPLSFSPRSPTAVAQPARGKGGKVGGGAACGNGAELHVLAEQPRLLAWAACALHEIIRDIAVWRTLPVVRASTVHVWCAAAGAGTER